MIAIKLWSNDHVLSLRIGCAFNFAFDVISLAEEGMPIVQHFLVLVRKIIPIRPAVLRFE